jgi:hypothetical protein
MLAIVCSEIILTDYDLLNNSINYPRGIKIHNCFINNRPLTNSVCNAMVFGTLQLQNQLRRTKIKNSTIHKLIIDNCSMIILKNVIINILVVKNNSNADFAGTSDIQNVDVTNDSNLSYTNTVFLGKYNGSLIDAKILNLIEFL